VPVTACFVVSLRQLERGLLEAGADCLASQPAHAAPPGPETSREDSPGRAIGGGAAALLSPPARATAAQ
jgi:hypothetical protein